MEVRRLYFLELEDHVTFEDLGPYIHIYHYPEGGEQSVAYDLEDFEEIPDKPGTPFEQAEPGTELFALWQQYNLYQAILLHEGRRVELRNEYLRNVARHLLTTCISEEDRATITTPKQYGDLYMQAMCPEIGEEDIVAVLAGTFPGHLERAVLVGFLESLGPIWRELFSDSRIRDLFDAPSKDEQAGVWSGSGAGAGDVAMRAASA